ncbi:hypothetical protein AWENTII_006963 [Aspergillus wentii]
MIKGKELFRHIHDQQGHYNAKLHIAEMIALFSPPVPEVLQRYQYMQEYSWPEPVRQEDNRVYKTAEEYFCGPFFNNNGIWVSNLKQIIFRLTKHLRWISLQRSDP